MPEDKPIYVVHPNYVTSINDGDRHYIGFVQLCRLYGLDPTATNVLNGDRPMQGRPREHARHLFPRADGQYEYV